MKIDVAIAVFESFEKAAHAIRKLQQDGFADESVSIVTHDVGAEVPSSKTISEGSQRVLTNQLDNSESAAATSIRSERYRPPGAIGQFSSYVAMLTSEFFNRLTGRNGKSEDELASSISDYQQLIKDGHLLVVVTEKTSQVEKAADILASENAKHVSVYYAPRSTQN